MDEKYRKMVRMASGKWSECGKDESQREATSDDWVMHNEKNRLMSFGTS